jgi:hypothetical protein
MAKVIDISLPDDGLPHLMVTAGTTGASVRVAGVPFVGGSDMASSGSTYSGAFPLDGDTQLHLGDSEKLYGMNLTVSGGAMEGHILVTDGSVT